MIPSLSISHLMTQTFFLFFPTRYVVLVSALSLLSHPCPHLQCPLPFSFFPTCPNKSIKSRFNPNWVSTFYELCSMYYLQWIREQAMQPHSLDSNSDSAIY